MKKIAVVGHKGRMGSLITKELQKYYEIVGIGRENDLNELRGVDLVIDFASHESSVISAEFCLKNNIPIIIGSTGHTKEELEKIDQISKIIKVVKKANFSEGIEILKDCILKMLSLNPLKIQIIEKHHKHKKDSPSGTALELESFIKSKFYGEVEIISIREGEEMGEHKIVVFCGDENLEIKHNVYARDAFVRGVVAEVNNVLNR